MKNKSKMARGALMLLTFAAGIAVSGCMATQEDVTGNQGEIGIGNGGHGYLGPANGIVVGGGLPEGPLPHGGAPASDEAAGPLPHGGAPADDKAAIPLPHGGAPADDKEDVAGGVVGGSDISEDNAI